MTRPSPLSIARTLALGAVVLAAGAAAEASFPGDNGLIVVARPGQRLVVLDPDGSDPRSLDVDSTGAMFPRWSPEGNRIAVVRNGNLVVLRPNGELLRTRTDHGDVVGAPSWSPDGTQLAYVRSNGELWVVSARAGHNGAAVALPGGVTVTSAAWSPSTQSSRIAFTDGGAIHEVDPDSGDVQEIVPADPEGRTRSELSSSRQVVPLVFTATAADATTRVDSQAGPYVSEPTDRSGAWSPSGDRILFTRAGVLSLFNPDGGQVTSLGFSGLTPDWQPRLVAPGAVYETDAGTTLTFRIRAPNEIPVTASFATLPGSATDGTDFQGISGSLPLGPDPFGYVASISVLIHGDTDPEQDESFHLELRFSADPLEALTVRGTILDDDHGTAINGLVAYTAAAGAAVLDPIFGNSELLFAAPASTPVFSPAGDRVAYVTLVPLGGPQLVIADANGTTLATFHNTPVDEVHWSPDGARIAWTDGNMLWVADPANGSSATAIVSDARAPSWSSDTAAPRRLAFARLSTGRVCTAREDGTNASCPTLGYQPRWSPDNSTIAFLQGDASLFLMNPDGSNQRFVTSLPGAPSGQPTLRWSPRDSFLALMTGDTLIVRQEAGPQTTVPGLPPILGDFDWSPDGRHLVVQGTAPAMVDQDLWIVGPNDAGTPLAAVEQVLGPSSGAFAPRWSTARPGPKANLQSSGGVEVFLQARVEVTLSAPSPATVTLGWETIDTGSATPGVDFVPVTGATVTLEPGRTRVPLLVTLLDDGLSEGTEFFDVQLTTASGARLGPASRVSVHINDDEPPRLPVAADDTFPPMLPGRLTAAYSTLLLNDVHPDGHSLTVVFVDGPSHGVLTDRPGFEAFFYDSDPGYLGTDSFTYRAFDGVHYSNLATVFLQMTPLDNDVVANPDSYTAAEDTLLPVAAPGVLANDFNPSGYPLQAQAVAGPAHGTLTLRPDGSFDYNAHANYNGADSFTYRAFDSNSISDPATVTITVTPVNDDPVAAADAFSTAEDTPLSLPAPGVLGNDTDGDGDGLTAVLVAAPLHGTLTLAPGGAFTYGPSPNYAGADSFSYRAVDPDGATSAVVVVTIDVTAVNDPPVSAADVHSVAEDGLLLVDPPGILGNDSDVDGDPLAANLWTAPAHGFFGGLHGIGSFRYTPAPNFNGTVSFTYKASDPSGAYSPETTVTITVTPVNDPPVAFDQDVVTEEGTPAAIVLSAGDVEGSALTYAIAAAPAHGTLTGTAPSLTYTPAVNYTGVDGFTFIANDGGLDSNLATIRIQVDPAAGHETVAGVLPPGGSLTTDTEGDGATLDDPIETTLITPQGGAVTLDERRAAPPPPTAFTFLDQLVQVTAPTASTSQPLVLTFLVDFSLLPPATAANLAVFRNSVQVPPCAGPTGTASPDPCVRTRETLADGDARIEVLSSQASLWTFGVPRATAGLALGALRPQTGGIVVFAATALASHPVGTLSYQKGSERLVAATLSGFAVSADGRSAWLAGVGLDGRTFLAYAEDRGTTGDRFQLWIGGIDKTGDGQLAAGNVFVVR